MILTGLIPGPKEPKNTDAYVDVLVNDIVALNKLTVYDGYADEMFDLKANIVLNIFDYPGQNKVLHCLGELHVPYQKSSDSETYTTFVFLSSPSMTLIGACYEHDILIVAHFLQFSHCYSFITFRCRSLF